MSEVGIQSEKENQVTRSMSEVGIQSEKENQVTRSMSEVGIQSEKENEVTRSMSEVGIQSEKENEVTRILSAVGIQREKENEVTRILSVVGIQSEKENQVTKTMLEVALGNSLNSTLDSEQGEMREEQTEIEVTRQFTTDINNIFCMSPCHDSSIWISDGTHDTVMHLNLKKEKPQIISQFNIVVHDMAITPSGDLILAVDGNKTLQAVDQRTGKLSNSKYTLSWRYSRVMPLCIHVTRDKVITGVVDRYQFLSFLKGMLKFLGATGYSSVLEPVKKKPSSLTFVGNSVKWLREKIGQPEGFIFTMSTFTAALVINFLSWIQIF
ncbi:unnamed protein product [Mytilus edulis]|uniref:Uncharacterized protein n=1 Tax=Mytilus edulis TaxID=6550 RepID=A0A8S3QI23_MYTED|nr:unnamed protein product [Mytilus edulis]